MQDSPDHPPAAAGETEVERLTRELERVTALLRATHAAGYYANSQLELARRDLAELRTQYAGALQALEGYGSMIEAIRSCIAALGLEVPATPAAAPDQPVPPGPATAP